MGVTILQRRSASRGVVKKGKNVLPQVPYGPWFRRSLRSALGGPNDISDIKQVSFRFNLIRFYGKSPKDKEGPSSFSKRFPGISFLLTIYYKGNYFVLTRIFTNLYKYGIQRIYSSVHNSLHH